MAQKKYEEVLTIIRSMHVRFVGDSKGELFGLKPNCKLQKTTKWHMYLQIHDIQKLMDLNKMLEVFNYEFREHNQKS